MSSSMLLYLLTISLWLVLAALIAEWVLIRLRRPARWVWPVAMLLCVALPFMPATPSRPTSSLDPLAAESGVPAAVSALTEALPAPTDWVPEFIVPRAWLILASLAATALLLTGWVLLLLRARRWPRDLLDGTPVLRAPATGPAVVGFLRPRIVVPQWAFALPLHQRRMLLAHEQQHIDARDPLLLLLGALVVAAMPWNPLLWFGLGHLRGAIEIDCDRRVLAGGEAADGYARCLIESVTLAAAGPVPAVGALSLSSSHLERRVALMLRTERPLMVVSIAAAMAGVALVTSAVMASPPTPAATPARWQKAVEAIEAQPYKRAERYYNRLLEGKVGNTEALYGVFYDNWSIRDPKAKGC